MNRLIVSAFAAALLGSPALAKDAPAASPVAASTAPAVAVSTAGASVSTEPATAESVIARLKALDESIGTLQCSFKQSLVMADTGLTQDAEGKVYYKKPDGLRLEYSKPRRQVAVSDKKDIWIHQLDENQVIRANWEDWKKTQFNVTGLLDFGSYATILDKHVVEVEDKAGQPLRLTLRPKDKAQYVLTLVLGRDDGFPSEWTLVLDKMTVKTELTDVKRNLELADGLFHFTPPPDVPVINFTAPRGD